MAVRQYIGARYVAKIYVNSLDASSADWESGVAYEPLTMVTYNSSSYISRKDVPASVGNPADNQTYWAVTGLYNGQILSLDNRVTALETQNGSETLNLTSQTLSGAVNELASSITGDIQTELAEVTMAVNDVITLNAPANTFRAIAAIFESNNLELVLDVVDPSSLIFGFVTYVDSASSFVFEDLALVRDESDTDYTKYKVVRHAQMNIVSTGVDYFNNNASTETVKLVGFKF